MLSEPESKNSSLDQFLQKGTFDQKFPSLVYIEHNSPSIDYRPLKNPWSNKQKRAYFRAKSGIHAHAGEKLRFMTLTTAQIMNKKPLNQCRQQLTQRIRRLSPNRLTELTNEDGKPYLSKNKRAFFYPEFNRQYDKKLKHDYLNVYTTEGVDGVIHVLFFGSYIPQEWLSDTWMDITESANIVDIRLVKNRKGDSKNVAKYVVTQYAITQSKNGEPTHYDHFSNSWKWCFRGFIGIWREFKRLHRWADYDVVYSLWEDEITRMAHPPPLPYTFTLEDFDFAWPNTEHGYPSALNECNEQKEYDCKECKFHRTNCNFFFTRPNETKPRCIHGKTKQEKEVFCCN